MTKYDSGDVNNEKSHCSEGNDDKLYYDATDIYKSYY